MEMTNGSKALRTRNAQDQRRHSSTFSCYYLNKQAKDLASIAPFENRQDTDNFILEQDYYQQNPDKLLTLPDRGSKAGDKQTTATRAMISFKSELNSLIGNLQDTTQHQNMILNGLRGRIYKNPRDTNNLLSRVLQLLKRHSIEPQALNGLRFECKR